MKTDHAGHLNILGNHVRTANGTTLKAVLKQWQQRLGYFSVFAVPLAVLTPQANAAGPDEAKDLAHTDTAAGQRAKRFGGINRRLRQPDFLARQTNYLLPHQRGNPNIVNAFTGGDNCPGNPIPPGFYTENALFTDTGDTSGANNTVGSLDQYYYYYSASTIYPVNGPDLIYSFTLSSRGANPEIRVQSSASNYVPAIYILDGRGSFGSCPSGMNQAVGNWHNFSESRVAGQPAVLGRDQLEHLPLNVPLYLFVDARNAGHGGPYTLSMKDLNVSPGGPRTRLDFDRDGRADLSVFRPSDGRWYINDRFGGFTGMSFGIAGDKRAPADYDGDGRTDFAVFRDGVWYWLNSSNNSLSVFPFGLAGDIPQSGDYDGDGRSELALYRGGIWYRYNLRSGQSSAVPFGLASDKPVAGDYDGDGKMDEAVFRDGTFYMRRSLTGFQAISLGVASDVPVPANYYWDRTIPAVFRNGTWIIAEPDGRPPSVFTFGLATDIPVPADYEGNGFAKVAVYRDGVWYIHEGLPRFSTRRFGQTGDRPLAAPNTQ